MSFAGRSAAPSAAPRRRASLDARPRENGAALVIGEAQRLELFLVGELLFAVRLKAVEHEPVELLLVSAQVEDAGGRGGDRAVFVVEQRARARPRPPSPCCPRTAAAPRIRSYAIVRGEALLREVEAALRAEVAQPLRGGEARALGRVVEKPLERRRLPLVAASCRPRRASPRGPRARPRSAPPSSARRRPSASAAAPAPWRPRGARRASCR